MSGFGLFPFGTGPFGFGSIAEAAIVPEPVAGSRFIDPVTRDYVFDSATGHLGQMPPLRQRVLLTLMTQLGSSAVPGFGVRLPPKIDRTFVSSSTAMVRSALRQLTDVERIMRIDDITVDTGGSRAAITVSYTDLTTGERDSVRGR